jgi:hypothetical protein
MERNWLDLKPMHMTSKLTTFSDFHAKLKKLFYWCLVAIIIAFWSTTHDGQREVVKLCKFIYFLLVIIICMSGIVLLILSHIRGLHDRRGFGFDDQIYWTFIQFVTTFHKSLSSTGHSSDHTILINYPNWKKKKKLSCIIPQVNYTECVTAACRRS